MYDEKMPQDIADGIMDLMQAQRDLAISGYCRDHSQDDQARESWIVETEKNVIKQLQVLTRLDEAIFKHIKPE